MTFKEVRTRFAPSPTGYMHVGNLRTALYAYLIAKKAGGKFLLRIEDTDQERQVEGAVDIIYNTLRETGLIHDEGPDIGGDYGPYVQSERLPLYKEHVKTLIDSGHAYYCFCTKERLDELKELQELNKVPPKYDGHCSRLSKEEVDSLLAQNVPCVVRQKIPTDGETTFTDEVYGSITTPNSSLDDQILLKSDGYPTYNFANVVDDHLMAISHVIRGSEYLSSTPKYNLLYEAFGWEIPKYIHCPPVMKDASHKLSKRNGDASFEDLVEKGYLKEAILNYIALLGWAPKDSTEIFSLRELTETFSIDGISKSPAIFDPDKLNWLNGEYLRALSPEEFFEKAAPYMDKGVKREIDKKFLASLLQPRCEKLSDIPEQIDFLDSLPDYSIDLYTHKKMKTNPENSLESLRHLLPVIEGLENFSFDSIHGAVFELIESLGAKNGVILWPLRVALSGKSFTPGGGIEMALLLGKEETALRIKEGIDLLQKA